jgi:branched-chain amino acid aminotransferase
MIRDKKCILNGHLISIYEPAVGFDNRAFRYGDALFETIRVSNNQIMFLKDHVTRIKLGMTVLRMNLPSEFTTANLQDMISELLRHNAAAPQVRVRLTVYRQEGGYYTPETNDISFLIETDEVSNNYTLNQKGFWADIYTDIKKPINKLSNIKTGNALMYVMAGISKQSMKLDECFILNETGNIIESISSNVFAVKNGTLYTPPLSEGCIAGVMRKQIIHLATENKILTFESPLTTYTLMNADEIFLTNSVQGVQWIGQFRDKFYTNKMAQFFNEKLIGLSATPGSYF